MFDTTHAHITTWVIALILFVIAIVLLKGGNQKGAKIVQMILRVFYILILITGIGLYMNHGAYDHMQYGLKTLGGIVIIAMMEMVLVRTKKEKPTGIHWAIFIIAFLVTFYLGAKLPVGWNWFS